MLELLNFFFHRFTLEIPNDVLHDNLFSVWQQEVTGPTCLREDALCVTLLTVLSPIKHRVCFLLPDYRTVVECMLHQNHRHTIKMKKIHPKQCTLTILVLIKSSNHLFFALCPILKHNHSHWHISRQENVSTRFSMQAPDAKIELWWLRN